ncbi:putative membrane-bound proteins with a thioredoxin-like domain [Magnetospirillum gryphiswaldense MSR-1 v2]|uniref:Membrane-bound proteins with a thioredoxin-like domain n=1 Tax=Magnetospirillum gryphiswaldense (strain DSM 6361 / JCM 21280 / NBRC 15271 / MSR-1) TaxID=431944 RepID=V6F628_MAGGM|nr:TlpA disulfide reductase family protein [Magnetospirillum gryphiswaldense]CDK99958.1 putative membrane-bound proteins with a thioredoxin-like domain [Magnetospirillum gryphiswaldense MSR-1 v2]
MTTNRRIHALVAAILVIVSGQPLAAEPLPAGFQSMPAKTQAPPIPFTEPNGKAISFSDWRGKVVVLNVWATWCGPCVQEMPSLDRLAAQLPAERFAVLAVSQDKGGSAVAKPFLDKLGIKNLRALGDPAGRLSRDLGVRGLPTTFILDQQGNIVSRLEGPAAWDSVQVVSYLRRLAQ